MTDVLLITVPIYLVILAGYLAVLTGRVSADDNRAPGRFAINFALPALVFMAIVEQALTDTLSWTYILSYLAGSLGVGLLVLAFARGPGRRMVGPWRAHAGGIRVLPGVSLEGCFWRQSGLIHQRRRYQCPPFLRCTKCLPRLPCLTS